MTLLFCNTGWMEHFQGNTAADTIKGGGSYVIKNGMGHEVCNFAPHGKTLFGYVQSNGQGINITRLGADKNVDRISGGTVVWTARQPNGHTVVVGWYRNATVFRQYQRHATTPPSQAKSGIETYLITAPFADAKLLPLDARTLQVPRQVKGGMGQSLVWYADDPAMEHFRKEVHTLIEDGTAAPPARTGSRNKPDQAHKALVEKAAITTIWEHYERLGYEVKSVERDNVGWDLEAVNGKARLRIEVKGLSGNAQQIELSPNEFVAFNKQADDYRLAVVSDALRVPTLLVARFSQERKDWLVECNTSLAVDIRPRTGAVVRFGEKSRWSPCYAKIE